MVALQGQNRSGGLSVWRKVVIALHSATSIKFPQVNYLTFGGLLSRNAGDFLGSVDVWVDFFEYLSIKQFIVFQAFVKEVLIWVK